MVAGAPLTDARQPAMDSSVRSSVDPPLGQFTVAELASVVTTVQAPEEVEKNGRGLGISKMVAWASENTWVTPSLARPPSSGTPGGINRYFNEVAWYAAKWATSWFSWAMMPVKPLWIMN
jgi:hypothetical protein